MSDEDDKQVTVVKNATDLQRLKLDKLMKNPEKPAFIPDRPKDKKFSDPAEFVRNVMGSSAGAGSGEFHVYRHIRRREYARQDFLQNCKEKDELDREYHRKLEENKRLVDEKAGKKRAKRQRQKEKQKAKRQKLKEMKKKGIATGEESSSSSSSSSSEEEDEEEEKKEEDREIKKENKEDDKETGKETRKMDEGHERKEERRTTLAGKNEDADDNSGKEEGREGKEEEKGTKTDAKNCEGLKDPVSRKENDERSQEKNTE